MTTKIAPRSLQKHFFHKYLRDKLLSAKYSLSTVGLLKDSPQSHSTIHKDEIKKFSKLTANWWDCNGPMKPLHSMNSIRIPFIRDGLIMCPNEKRRPTPLKDKKILDVGCGGGILSEGLSKIGAEVTGIDASKELIEIAEDHSKKNPKLINKPNYLCITIEIIYFPVHPPVQNVLNKYIAKVTYKKIYFATFRDACESFRMLQEIPRQHLFPIRNLELYSSRYGIEHSKQHENHYDAVVASEVIEHVNNKELFVKKCVDVLKPGGSIFFTTPNRTNASKLLTICAAEYIFNVIPQGTHQYEMFITPNELTFLLERNNCHVEAVYGTIYNLLLDKWDFISSQALMYALHAEKLDN